MTYNPSDLTRRNFLSAMAAVTYAAGCADPRPRARCDGSPRRVGAPPPGYEPQVPFSLSSQSVLSEDYFEIVNHKIDVDNGDKVVAYTRSNGDTEAVVLQDGVVKLVYRDSSQAGGWAVFALPDAIGVADMVAAVGQAITGPAYLEISYVTHDRPDVLVVATQSAGPIGSGGPTFDTKTVGWNAKAGPLAITMGASTAVAAELLEPLVSAMVPGSEFEQGSDALVYWHFRNWSGVLSGFSFNTWDGDRSWSLSRLASRYTNLISGGFVLDIAKADGSLELWGLAGLVGGKMDRLDVPAPYPPQDASGMRTVVSDIVALLHLKFASADALPAALVWTQHQIPVDGGALAGDPQLWLVSFNGDSDAPDWVWTNLAVPTDQNDSFDIPVTTALTPRKSAKDGYLVDVFVSWGGTLRVVRQIEQGGTADATNPVFTPLIPLQPDVLAMSSQASPSAGNQLILVGADGTLQTLVKGASGGWTDTAMHLPASELQEVSSYRVTLTLADTAWNAPVGGHDVVITASTPILAVIEGPSPKTVLLGGVPVTATTDANGDVVLALLAEGLSAPTLTVIATGLPTPATVYPSEPINTYMQGTGTLNFLPAMSGGTLSDAKTADGQTVAPGAADADTASQAASTMKQAAELGAQGTLLGVVASTVGRVDGNHAVGVEILGSSIDHWAQDALHAVKKGAIAVEHVAIDAEKKLVTIAMDVENWADNTVQIVVHTIEDAAHVLHAVLNHLEADIVNAVKWLRALVTSLLQDSARVAKQFSALLEQAVAFVGDESDKVKATLDNWFTGKEKAIQDSFDRLRSGYSKSATLGTISDFNPAKPGGAASKPPGNNDDEDDTPQPHGDWFLNKVKHAIYGELDTPDLKAVSYDKLQLDLMEACASQVGDLQAAAQDFWRFLEAAVSHPSDFPTLAVAALLEAVSKLVQAALRLLKAIIDALFDMVAALSKVIPDMLRTKIGSAGIVGKLLSLAGLGDFEIGTVAMMVLAFPATLAYKIANGPATRPFSYVTDAQDLGANPDADRALQITASSVMGVSAALSVANVMLDAVGHGVPLLTPAMDIAGPLVVGALAPPFVTDGLPDWRRMTDSTEDAEALCSWVLGLLPAYGSAQVLYATKSKEVDASNTEETALWVQTMCGVLSLVTGVLAAGNEPGASGVDYAGPILSNIANIAACCNTDLIKEPTEGLSVVVGTGLGFWSSLAGAVLYGLP